MVGGLFRKIYLQLYRAAVARLAKALFAVFDRLGRAAGNACHAVRAVILPNRMSVVQRDGACRAELRAQAAAGAFFIHSELLGVDEERIERFVHNAAFELVGSAHLRLRERSRAPWPHPARQTSQYSFPA